jgi:hypothetical protein
MSMPSETFIGLGMQMLLQLSLKERVPHPAHAYAHAHVVGWLGSQRLQNISDSHELHMETIRY